MPDLIPSNPECGDRCSAVQLMAIPSPQRIVPAEVPARKEKLHGFATDSRGAAVAEVARAGRGQDAPPALFEADRARLRGLDEALLFLPRPASSTGDGSGGDR